MAASYLLSECLEKIFLNLLDENPSGDTYAFTSTKDLYSCTLVSRYWCRISSPFLYAYPFHHFRHLAYSNIYLYFRVSKVNHLSYFKLIRTLLSCIPKSEIKQIILSNLLDSTEEFSFPDILTTFNYVTFIRGLIFSSPRRLFYYKDIWLSPYIQNNKDSITEDQFSNVSIPILIHLVKFLCKHCNNLTTLEFPCTVEDNEFFNDIIELLTYKGHNGRSKLSGLKQLYSSTFQKNDLYLALSNNICNLNLLYNEEITSIEKANSLSQFISLQKKLQHVILCSTRSNVDVNYSVVFNSLSTQNASLRILEFKNLSFNKINKEALNSLCLLKNIMELKLYECEGINDNLNSWARNLTRLEVLEYVEFYTTVPGDFLTQLIKSSSNTLTKLVINYGRSSDQDCQLLQQILPYLKSLTYIDLPRIYPSELISIFKSCTRLVYLGAILSNDRTLWGKNFGNLGKFIPKNLQKIQFREMESLVFNSNELEHFFKECVNNDSKLKYLEIVGKYDNVGQEYFDVAGQFGVQLI